MLTRLQQTQYIRRGPHICELTHGTQRNTPCCSRRTSITAIAEIFGACDRLESSRAGYVVRLLLVGFVIYIEPPDRAIRTLQEHSFLLSRSCSFGYFDFHQRGFVCQPTLMPSDWQKPWMRLARRRRG